MKKIIPFLVCLLVAVIACKKEDIFPLAESITFDDTSIEVPVGESKYIYYTILPEQVGDTATVYFSSADESIARVNEWGSVTGVKEGHTTVTATVHGKTASVEVEVTEPVIKKIILTYNGLPLPDVMDIPYGEGSIHIDIDVKPSSIDMSEIKVSSEDESIVLAKRTGKKVVITPQNEGETTIVVKGGDIKHEIKVRVQKMIRAEKVVIDQKNPEVGLNATLQLTATTTPENIGLPTRVWSSSNPNVAEVDAATGIVTGKSAGMATITVTVDGVSASTEVTVLYVKPQSVAIKPNSITIALNDTYQLEALTTPAKVSKPEVTWSSSDNGIVSVDKNGLITAKSVGSATITANVDGISGTSTVTVSKDAVITGFELVASTTEVETNKSVTLSIKNLQPSGASLSNIEWSVSDSDMASISVNKANGTCVLTAKDRIGYVTVIAQSNGVVQTQRIHITKVSVQSVSIKTNTKLIDGAICFWAPSANYDYAETAYGSGSDIELTVTVNPSNASFANNVTITSSSSDVQVKKEGNAYKLYVSKAAKGNYTIEASCDGATATASLYAIPNAFTLETEDIYGYPGKTSTFNMNNLKSNLNNYTIKKSLITSSRYIQITNNYNSITQTNNELTIKGNELAYGSKYADTFTVETVILGKTISNLVSVYNSYYGMSFEYQVESGGERVLNDDTGYYYYISEGTKTTNCNLIGYNTPKFRAKVKTGSGSYVTSGTILKCQVFVHYYNPKGTSRGTMTCLKEGVAESVASYRTYLDDATQTKTLPGTTNMTFKFDFYD
jgi:uncharacterized protein YjdB